MTIKELFPSLSIDQRAELGERLARHGVKRIGKKIEEAGFMVNVYNEQDYSFIIKFAVKLFGNG